MSSSLVLLPTYNELQSLPLVLGRLAELREVDVLVLDDDSPDGTGELAEELTRAYPRLSVLHRRRKEGLGRAYLHGFREATSAGYARVVTMDADLSHAPEDVPRLLAALERADVAIGSRHVSHGGVENWPFSRRLLSRLGSVYARTLLRLPVSDVTSGFRAYRREVLELLDFEAVRARGFIFQVEVLRRILDRPGARAVEVPILFRNRTLGHSKLSLAILFEAASSVLALSARRRRASRRAAASESRARRSVSVIVPAAQAQALPEAIAALERGPRAASLHETFVVRGSAPAAQRNVAALESRGDYLLFLDDDSIASAELLDRYAKLLDENPGVAAAGGPALAPGELSSFQSLASLVLSEPWVMGRSASRYRSRGALRSTDERELIFCNLCLRRRAFEEVGGLDERLYPNEENDLLERLRARGWQLLYDPEAAVERAPRRTLRGFLHSIFRYGRGRSAQLRLAPTRTSLLRLALVLTGAVGAVTLGALSVTWPLAALGVVASYFAVLALRFSRRAGARRALLASTLAAATHASYALGLLTSLLRKPAAPDRAGILVERRPSPAALQALASRDEPGGDEDSERRRSVDALQGSLSRKAAS